MEPSFSAIAVFEGATISFAHLETDFFFFGQIFLKLNMVSWRVFVNTFFFFKDRSTNSQLDSCLDFDFAILTPGDVSFCIVKTSAQLYPSPVWSVFHDAVCSSIF